MRDRMRAARKRSGPCRVCRRQVRPAPIGSSLMTGFFQTLTRAAPLAKARTCPHGAFLPGFGKCTSRIQYPPVKLRSPPPTRDSPARLRDEGSQPLQFTGIVNRRGLCLGGRARSLFSTSAFACRDAMSPTALRAHRCRSPVGVSTQCDDFDVQSARGRHLEQFGERTDAVSGRQLEQMPRHGEHAHDASAGATAAQSRNAAASALLPWATISTSRNALIPRHWNGSPEDCWKDGAVDPQVSGRQETKRLHSCQAMTARGRQRAESRKSAARESAVCAEETPHRGQLHAVLERCCCTATTGAARTPS